MTIWRERCKNYQRPRKKDSEKRRREQIHRRRLIALGMPADQVARLDPSKVRALLKRPLKIKKQYQKALA
jgi:hypothetical protein